MRVAFDCETWLAAPGRQAPRTVCTAITDKRGTRLLAREDAVPEIVRLVNDPDVELVGHNIAYDFGSIAATLPPTKKDRGAFLKSTFKAYDDGRVTDTMVREMLRAIGLGRLEYDPTIRRKPKFSLAELASKYLGVEMSGKAKRLDDGTVIGDADSWRLRYHELDGVPVRKYPPDAAHYAKFDAEVTARVEAAQRATDSPWPNESEQYQAAWGLHLMGCHGFRTDPVQTRKMIRKYRRIYLEKTDALVKYGVVTSDGSKKTRAIQDRVIKAYDGSPPTTKKGGVKTDRPTLEQSGDPVLRTLAERGQADTYLTRYLNWISRGFNRPITPRWNVLVETGRTSSAWQQLPREGGIRECIIPRPGYVFALCDYSAAELRTFAQVLLNLFGYSRMAEVFADGLDPHLMTAAAILGIEYEVALARYKAGDKTVKDARHLSKAANFGFPGGLGPGAFVEFAWNSYKVEIAEGDARDLKYGWLDLYPEVRRFFDYVGQLTSEGGGQATITQPFTGRVQAGAFFTSACNTHFQGPTSDYAKKGLYEAQRACYGAGELGEADPLFGSRPCFMVHDEIDAEVPGRDRLRRAEAGERLASIMEAAANHYTPDVPALVEPALATRLSKNAETVRGRDGVLDLWEWDAAA